jgi:hypothetical protein
MAELLGQFHESLPRDLQRIIDRDVAKEDAAINMLLCLCEIWAPESADSRLCERTGGRRSVALRESEV